MSRAELRQGCDQLFGRLARNWTAPGERAQSRPRAITRRDRGRAV